MLQIAKTKVKKKKLSQELILFITGLLKRLQEDGYVIFAEGLVIYNHFVINCMIILIENIMKISIGKNFIVHILR